jgi:hypothetical protein
MMMAFKYHVVTVFGETLQEERLCSLGRGGWELVQVIPLGDDWFEYIFRRPFDAASPGY